MDTAYVYFNAGDIVQVKHAIDNRPKMLVVDKVSRSMVNKDGDKETTFLGGKVLTFTDKKTLGYAVCIPQNDHVLIKEFACDNDERIFLTIADHFKMDKLMVRVLGEKIPFAMSYWYTDRAKTNIEEPPYISLVLD